MLQSRKLPGLFMRRMRCGEYEIHPSAYYCQLETAQKGNLDITAWLEWFVTCINHALSATEATLTDVLRVARFWEGHATSFNERQRLMINKLFSGFIGKLTTSKWAQIAKCSQDTALRDIQDLIDRGVLIKEEAGGRSTRYVLCDT